MEATSPRPSPPNGGEGVRILKPKFPTEVREGNEGDGTLPKGERGKQRLMELGVFLGRTRTLFGYHRLPEVTRTYQRLPGPTERLPGMEAARERRRPEVSVRLKKA